MNKLKRTRPFFLTICLILSITLFLLNSTTITLIDSNSDLKASQLSKSEKHSEIKDNPKKNVSNIEQLSDTSLETNTNQQLLLHNNPDTDVQNIVSRGNSNRTTYDNSNEVKNPIAPTTSSKSQTEVSPSSSLQAAQSTQAKVDSQYENDLDLLSRLITAEAQGEPYDAQVAVGAVVINRLESGLWSNTIKNVIYQNIDGYYQFTPVENGWINKPAKPESIEAAKAAMSGVDPTNGAQFYYDDKATNEWILSKPISIQIGHMIYAY